jgi:hypothetical protein
LFSQKAHHLSTGVASCTSVIRTVSQLCRNAPAGNSTLRWQSMHTTQRPVGDIRTPMGCEEEKTVLADIAYFNSLMCKTIIRFNCRHIVT